MPQLSIAQDDAADELLGRGPLALLIGMLLNQHMRQRSSARPTLRKSGRSLTRSVAEALDLGRRAVGGSSPRRVLRRNGRAACGSQSPSPASARTT